MKSYYLVCAFAVMAAAHSSESDGLMDTALRFLKDCGDNPLSLCIKERALRYVDNVSGDVNVVEGVSLIQTGDAERGGRALSEVKLPEEPEARENEVDTLLFDRVARFMGSHTLQFKVPKDSIEDMKRSLEEARKKGKKTKKLLLPLLLLLKLKAAALIPLLLGGLAFIAFKALIIGKLALLIAGSLALKKLLGGKQSSQSYEVVSHPHYSQSSSYDEHHGHGWSRNLGDVQDIVYNAHVPSQ